jgi:Gpi18-like mannosyltransferase
MAFGFAASFKPQAIFLGPFLAGLVLAERLPWRYLPIPPAIYILCGPPEVLAGRPGQDVALHWVKATQAPGLTYNASNWYQWAPCGTRSNPLVGWGLACRRPIAGFHSPNAGSRK